MITDCKLLQDKETGRYYCPLCDRYKSRTLSKILPRNCHPERAKEKPPAKVEDFVPLTPEDMEFRFEICRRDICGHYVRNRGADGKEQELCYCKTTCKGKPTPVEKVCRDARGCPEGHF